MRHLKKGSILMDAIGKIDDRFIAEAEYHVSVNRNHVKKRMLVALVLVLTFAFTLTLFIGIANIFGEKNSNESVGPDINNDRTLDGVLTAMRDETDSFVASLDGDMLPDGNSYIIWRYSGEADYRVCRIDTSYSQKISEAFRKKENFKRVGRDYKETTIEEFWICFGDGIVYTPYLEDSTGNIGIGFTFDYEPELEPSENFAALIEEAIRNGIGT